MASIEFIEKRIAGYEAKLTKLENKLERIRKAEATGWEVNPYYYEERDKRYTERDIEETRQNLEKYRAALVTEREKAGSRDVKAILDFLANWKTNVSEYYKAQYMVYRQEKAAWLKYDSEFCDWANHGGWKDPNKAEKRAEYNDRRRQFYSKWRFLDKYLTTEFDNETYTRKEVLNTEKLDKDLEQEANAMYDDIIQRTNEITGKITDASGLDIGEKGELNGYIKGERGTAHVHTIGAGGYNIQRFHFRTLVHKA